MCSVPSVLDPVQPFPTHRNFNSTSTNTPASMFLVAPSNLLHPGPPTAADCRCTHRSVHFPRVPHQRPRLRVWPPTLPSQIVCSGSGRPLCHRTDSTPRAMQDTPTPPGPRSSTLWPVASYGHKTAFSSSVSRLHSRQPLSLTATAATTAMATIHAPNTCLRACSHDSTAPRQRPPPRLLLRRPACSPSYSCADPSSTSSIPPSMHHIESHSHESAFRTDMARTKFKCVHKIAARRPSVPTAPLSPPAEIARGT